MSRMQDRLTFGGRLPWSVGFILVVTAIASLSAAFITRHGASLFELGSLAPALVWRLQVWRLVTWPFLQPDPISFIIACLMLYWFGRDVANDWGDAPFLRVFGGVVLGAGVITCLIARVDPGIFVAQYLGGWPISSAMIVAWGLTFPDRVVRIYFVLPIRGYWLAWLTIAFTVVFAIYMGWQLYFPQLVAQALILAYLYRGSIRAAVREKKKERRVAVQKKKRAQSVAYLKLLDSKEDDELPPLPPDIEKKLRGEKPEND
jgi:membrane associated rhomboid family serine protease